MLLTLTDPPNPNLYDETSDIPKKWKARHELRGLSKEHAMKRYVELSKEIGKELHLEKTWPEPLAEKETRKPIHEGLTEHRR
jgi:hypothetical protein